MKRSNLRELSENCIRNLTTSTFTAEEDLEFISFLDEVDESLKKTNKIISDLVTKYEVVIENGMIKDEVGDIQKFKEAYELFMGEEIEIPSKLKYGTIIKLKNENKLPTSIFKTFLDNLQKK